MSSLGARGTEKGREMAVLVDVTLSEPRITLMAQMTLIIATQPGMNWPSAIRIGQIRDSSSTKRS
ncbi:MAG: hypothetical protein Q7O66_15185 [Dehalococcoidia bacterium]|nr:hypothetical protein [Dehalococcoidia bacterium]